jgi:hypothetical protein
MGNEAKSPADRGKRSGTDSEIWFLTPFLKGIITTERDDYALRGLTAAPNLWGRFFFDTQSQLHPAPIRLEDLLN